MPRNGGIISDFLFPFFITFVVIENCASFQKPLKGRKLKNGYDATYHFTPPQKSKLPRRFFLERNKKQQFVIILLDSKIPVSSRKFFSGKKGILVQSSVIHHSDQVVFSQLCRFLHPETKQIHFGESSKKYRIPLEYSASPHKIIISLKIYLLSK